MGSNSTPSNGRKTVGGPFEFRQLGINAETVAYPPNYRRNIMPLRISARFRPTWALLLIAMFGASVEAQDVSLRPDGKPGVAGKPVKVFILMGQSNMVGMGDIGPVTAKGTLEYLTKTEK